jgi:hypothetical protein
VPTTDIVNGLQVFDTTADDLITETIYGGRGLVGSMIDPEGQITSFVYDDLNRQIAVIENHDETPDMVTWDDEAQEGPRWVVTYPQDNDPDVNRVTSFVYDGVGNLIKQVAHSIDDETEVVQVTQYVYGVADDDSPHASEINTNNLLRMQVLPDNGEIVFAYNRLGEVIVMEDQNGTVHAYDRDDIGRVTADKATALGAGIDDAVRAIGTSYDALGRVEFVTSYDDENPQQGTILNQVKFTYTPLGQVEQVYQQHDGPVNTQTSKFVMYDYATGNASSGNFSRLIEMHYPGQEWIEYAYGSAGSINDLISRVAKIDVPFAGAATQPINFHYIGMSMTAVVDYAHPDVQLDRTADEDGERNFGNSQVQSGTAGRYPGYDRFGRVVRHMWVDGAFKPWSDDDQEPGGESLHNDPTKPHVPPIFELTHTYDKSSNRLSRDNRTPTIAWDHHWEQFDYDGLHRLKTADRGYDDETTGFEYSILQASRQWDLDALGNWTAFADWDPQAGSNGEYVTAESRGHNDANELIEQVVGGSARSLTYDDNGNLRTRIIVFGTPPFQSSVPITYTWDAWNRLVRVEYGSLTRSEYDYNGLNWRIVKHADTSMAPDAGWLPSGTEIGAGAASHKVAPVVTVAGGSKHGAGAPVRIVEPTGMHTAAAPWSSWRNAARLRVSSLSHAPLSLTGAVVDASRWWMGAPSSSTGCPDHDWVGVGANPRSVRMVSVITSNGAESAMRSMRYSRSRPCLT